MAEIVRVIGLPELEAKLTPDLVAGPVTRLLTRAAIAVQGTAREDVAVDRGGLRRSIAYEIEGAPLPTEAIVGTNLDYAPDIEAGTTAHYVDPAELEPWAIRRGMGKGSGWAVSQHIEQHGTRAQPFLAPALAKNAGRIDDFIAIAAAEIEAEAGR